MTNLPVPLGPRDSIADAPLKAYPPLGLTSNGVEIVPDTVPDKPPAEYKAPRQTRYFKANVPGYGWLRKKLKLLDADLKDAIAEARQRPPTIGELQVIQSLLLCEQEILLINQWFKKNTRSDGDKDIDAWLVKAERQRKVAMERDRHFDRLGLGEKTQTSLVEMLYGAAVQRVVRE